jgi:hypothetical protein
MQAWTEAHPAVRSARRPAQLSLRGWPAQQGSMLVSGHSFVLLHAQLPSPGRSTFGSRAALSWLGRSGLRLASRGVGAGASSMPACGASPPSLKGELYLWPRTGSGASALCTEGTATTMYLMSTPRSSQRSANILRKLQGG